MNKGPTYRVCPRCGAHLDPCEICDCVKTRARESVAPTAFVRAAVRPVLGLNRRISLYAAEIV